jgi:hypothetical protein
MLAAAVQAEILRLVFAEHWSLSGSPGASGCPASVQAAGAWLARAAPPRSRW